jgi:hypothetical protein
LVLYSCKDNNFYFKQAFFYGIWPSATGKINKYGESWGKCEFYFFPAAACRRHTGQFRPGKRKRGSRRHDACGFGALRGASPAGR